MQALLGLLPEGQFYTSHYEHLYCIEKLDINSFSGKSVNYSSQDYRVVEKLHETLSAPWWTPVFGILVLEKPIRGVCHNQMYLSVLIQQISLWLMSSQTNIPKICLGDTFDVLNVEELKSKIFKI
jgi:hypothetical protein